MVWESFKDYNNYLLTELNEINISSEQFAELETQQKLSAWHIWECEPASNNNKKSLIDQLFAVKKVKSTDASIVVSTIFPRDL